MNRRARPALLLIVLLFASVNIAPGRETPTVKFTSPITYTLNYGGGVISGDFNNDGKMDLVVGCQMLLGTGDSRFMPAVIYYPNANPIAANDFNRDGKLDLATSDSNVIQLLLGKGDGSFAAPVTYPFKAGHILAVDFNNDGWLDFAGLGGIGINLLLGTGKGAFQSVASYSFGSGTTSTLAAGDFNGDGKVDLVVSIGTDSAVRVLPGNGDGTFQTPITSSSKLAFPTTGPHTSSVGDFDGDGKLDLALGAEALTILKGNGDGTFKPIFSYRLNNTSVDLEVADFNGDGSLDLVSAGIFFTAAFQVLLGNGDGTFADAGSFMPGHGLLKVTVADLNGDTKPDFVGQITAQTSPTPDPGIGLEQSGPDPPIIITQLLVILMNATPGGVDHINYFVHQHYLDFLHREPDASGFAFWNNQISSCGSDLQCIEAKRLNVSAAFSLSTEFQQRTWSSACTRWLTATAQARRLLEVRINSLCPSCA